ncbi:PTS sugar transporter subunit IIA [Enorma phocaeensis]|uniref:PTS sugar transporter subunit IIA n=1 Tax=Enorma phocaeensis TaxID=1871019 RepID=UPI0023539BCC|nr:PTS fructose transporter subunit IIA [Enorma phocaeensis]
MRYLVLVSHGTLAQGVHSVLKMLVGDNEQILSASLEDGMGAPEFVERLEHVLEVVADDDEVLLLGDIVGGSPLTNAMNVLASRGLLDHAVVMGGMNLPMAMTAVMQLQTADVASLKQAMLDEARTGAREIVIENDDEEEDL